MSFVNESISVSSPEPSIFFCRIREAMRMGLVPNDQWTVDRTRNLVLRRMQNDPGIDPDDEEHWTFYDGDVKYRFVTVTLDRSSLAGGVVRMKRSIAFVTRPSLAIPDAGAIELVRQALTEFKDEGVLSPFRACELTLVDGDGGVL